MESAPDTAASSAPTPLARRLHIALSELLDPPKPAELARLAGVKPPSVHGWFNGSTKSLGKALLPISQALGVRPEWLNTGRGPMRPGGNASREIYKVFEPDNSDWEYARDAYGPIHMIDAYGSCGGGAVAWELEPRAPLIKEAAWFKRYGVQSDDVIGVFADGDSMADFIVDGDIVLFNSRKTTPKSGAIFLIDHPDGMKIKRLRRDIDGSWILESNNPDKRRFPDERISPEHADLLRIRGEFIYRQGG
ncbi:LexA family transcriptional regulator [Pseudoxanthomonas sp. SE1]|uniref:LexA family transcriptional regulator n=1 Tax=Pseudoxanthomonas sp. SE1 TaxID=1664560 RepID=UPI00240DAF97|nr:LexA family transcriptional regulator [Pseudoxanthomonas sp. SE1]WFC43235.1 hypothetical protein OY559_06915 [Pseudoxanthomonas sp. SE1]